MKFLITEAVPGSFREGLLKIGIEPTILPDINPEEVLRVIHLYDGLLIRGRILANKELIEKATKLKYILRPGSGLDIVDIKEAEVHGVQVINSPEGNRDAVAEHAVGMLISLLKQIPRSFDDIKRFTWSRKALTGQEIMGKTIGIIGYGNTGSAFAKRLTGFGVNILAYDKYKTGFADENISEVSLDDIYQKVDIVSFHIPHNKENHFLLRKDYLEKFRKPIYLINTSRGKILQTNDLLSLIHANKIAGACLDVFENEDFDKYSTTDKKILDQLIETGKVILTPHIAGKTIESEEKIHSYLLEKLTNSLEN